MPGNSPSRSSVVLSSSNVPNPPHGVASIRAVIPPSVMQSLLNVPHPPHPAGRGEHRRLLQRRLKEGPASGVSILWFTGSMVCLVFVGGYSTEDSDDYMSLDNSAGNLDA